MANWTPEGYVGQLFKLIGSYIAPAAGLNPPSRWGTSDFIELAFKDAQHILTIKKIFNMRMHSAQHWLDLFRDYYGPVHKAFQALDDKTAVQFEKDILALVNSFNISGDDTLVLPSEYLEIVITK